MTDLELLTVGRVSVDLYAEQLDVPVEQVTTFRKSIGGTATNVAVATARLGHRVALFNRVGDDPMGRYVRHALEHTFGVDTRFVRVDSTYRTPLAFAVMEDPAEPTIDFYREPQAPDMMIEPSDVDRSVVEDVPIFWFPTSRLSAEPSRSTVHTLLEWRARRRHTVLDLDWRPSFWPDREAATRELDLVLDHVTMAIGNRTECEIAVGESDPDRAADALLARGLEAAVVKLGGDGVLVATADGMRERIPPYPVDVVCGLGAGDAFGGAFCHGLLSGWDLAACARAGNAAGAIVAARLMCADDMPYLSDIETVLERGSVPAGI
ncbi:MAG: 5-dehydro-2-deoxygluconokinase [Ilumatobacteraceae bacterium]